jgi:hypothetical protein
LELAGGEGVIVGLVASFIGGKIVNRTSVEATQADDHRGCEIFSAFETDSWPYLTGTIRCAYGVPGNIIHGPPECGLVEKILGSRFSPGPGMNITCGGEFTHS